ncbi:MAG TPA: hypothetical protein P5234_05010 [Thermoanaerobaculaceae bacterium]|nr:hypothetical protein [Thermoanaerobaculaceae bacterium]HRS15593.1 hypothetical protein [Thermoanaerobaculaceae bacterium]
MARKFATLVMAVLAAGAVQARELTWSYVIPAAANKAGLNGTDWHTDLTIYNPQNHTLPIVMQFMPAGRDNSGRLPTIEFDVYAWETLNLWDVLGPKGFNQRGQTGAIWVRVDELKRSCSGTAVECHFALTSRTYTLNPSGGAGEYGQATPGFPTNLPMVDGYMTYLPQLMDDKDFRTNAGLVSLTDGFVTVRFDLQKPNGDIIHTRDVLVPPYGQTQWRLDRSVTGGTLAAYIVGGPSTAAVVPYASVVNNVTGDAVYVEAHMTTVGYPTPAAQVASAATRGVSEFPGREIVPGTVVERQQRERALTAPSLD